MVNRIRAIKWMLVLAPAICLWFSSCKSCNKSGAEQEVKSDTTSTSASTPVNAITLPHADTSLIPVFSKILDDAFEACAKKDYKTLAPMIIYRGPDSLRFGKDVFNPKNQYELTVVRLTADVFNKWNNGVDSRDYSRVFDYNQPGAVDMKVLEVIFVSRKKVDRKFFGFIQSGNAWKIADVTSSLE